MKILIVTFLLLMAGSSPAVSQIFGRRLNMRIDSLNRVNKLLIMNDDSITKANKGLTAKVDSLSRIAEKYQAVYNVVRDKLIHHNFAPARFSFLLDSIKASRDSMRTPITLKSRSAASSDSVMTLLNTSSLRPRSRTSSDSIMMLLRANALLKADIDSVKVALAKNKSSVPSEDAGRANAISNLKKFKELLDAKIISDAEFLALKRKYLQDL